MRIPKEPEPKRTLRERVGALKNLPPFIRLVWETSRPLTVAQGVLRLGRALLPVMVLYVGKLIIDEVVDLTRRPNHDFTVIATLIAI
jgi:ATP-binding cassette subfamily B protein